MGETRLSARRSRGGGARGRRLSLLAERMSNDELVASQKGYNVYKHYGITSDWPRENALSQHTYMYIVVQRRFV